LIAVVLVAIIAAGATYAVVSTGMVEKSASTSTVSMLTSASATSGGTVVSEEPCCIDFLDPGSATTTQAMEVVQSVYQGLVIYAANGTNAIVPLIAQSYNVSSDGLTYTFQIRTGITFSNGDPLNSYVFWYSIYRGAIMAQSPSFWDTFALNTTSVTASMLNQYTTSTPPQSLVQIMQNPKNAIVAPSPTELVFHLITTFAPFLMTLTQPQASAVDPVVVAANGGVVAGQPNTWMNANMVGTGPFVLSQYQPNEQVTLERNPTYWGGVGNNQPTPSLDKVIIKYVPNALTRAEDVERGAAQIAYVDPALVAQAVSAGGTYVPNLGVGGQAIVVFFNLDMMKFPFNNKLIRQAVVHAINYTACLQPFHGFGWPWVGPIPIGEIGYNPNLQPYTYNLTLARQLLAQAGYPNGQGIPPLLMFAYTDSPPTVDIATIIQSNLADIGIQVKIVSGPYSSIEAMFPTSPENSTYPDFTAVSWYDPPDPFGFVNWFLGSYGYGPGLGNSGYYNNTEVTNLLQRATATLNEAERGALYAQISQIVYADVPDVWIGQFKNALSTGVPLISTTVGGYTAIGSFVAVDLSHIYLISQSSSLAAFITRSITSVTSTYVV